MLPEHFMYDAELKRKRELVRARRYVMTLHAEDDVSGQALDGVAVTVVTKFSPAGKLVFITVFCE
jgi:hypothetical protein